MERITNQQIRYRRSSSGVKLQGCELDCRGQESLQGQLCCFMYTVRSISCTIMRPPTKLQVFANFWTQKMLQPFITSRTLQIYLRQTIFCSPSWTWS